jgi:SAM-dependent methyltransferase
MNEYFTGEKLYGNDFSISEIQDWYEKEKEGYFELGTNHKKSYEYGYHMMNKIHGFNKILSNKFDNVLGFGSAYGYEFEPIIENIKKLSIIEPSKNMISHKIGNIIPVYFIPEVSGKLPFDDNSFDLITCFGTLHHIPNVSFVFSELVRVLKNDGHILIREPIVSMGDWRNKRTGLTANERGIPLSFFLNEFSKYPIKIISKEYCFSMTSFLQRIFGFFFIYPIYAYKYYVLFDKYVSSFLKNNVKYYSKHFYHKISPQSIFFVLKKI